MDYSNILQSTTPGQSLRNLVISGGKAEFDLEVTGDSSAYKANPGVAFSKHPLCQYYYGGKQVTMQLSTTDDPITTGAPFSLGSAAQAISNLRIVGASQGVGKMDILKYASNFSSVDSNKLRDTIHKNAAELTRQRTSSDTPINSVLYKSCNKSDGDIKVSGDLNYETLITKNCNVLISGDLNPSGKKFGIIALRDDSTNESIGNVYVDADVRYINALIYADGGLISTGFGDGDRLPNYASSSNRGATLDNQLVLVGSLFTRNTIGGSIL